ncbi:MAG TPA: metal ABC transporter permease [Sedimentisphaerales bacterium]|nr:metal ABC transporter permease [Sedimentisphaerales bacterium]
MIQILGLPFLVCILMSFILGYLGIHVLKREVIFIDIALAQVAAVGSIIAHLAFEVHGDSLLAYVCSLSCVLITALFYAVIRSKIFQISLEAIIGISYAIAAAAALFLVGIAPGGHIHVQNILSGSLLWTSWMDVAVILLTFSAVGFCFYLIQKPLTNASNGYQQALEKRNKTIFWDFIFYLLLGIVITLSVQIGGVVVVFAYLIIPATISVIISSRLGIQLMIIWAAATMASITGLLFSYYLDFSIGPSIALFLGGELILIAIIARFVGDTRYYVWRNIMKYRKASNLCLVTVAFVFLIWQMTSHLVALASADENRAAEPGAFIESIGNSTKEVHGEPNTFHSAKPNDRAGSVRAIASHLGLGKGSVIADVGAGSGRDTWVFAKNVGETGLVFAEEIAEDKVESLKTEANKRELSQVRVVLGRTDDPCLPSNSADLIYLNHVYHHLAKPRDMLRGIWRALRPGGHLVVVDRQRGTPHDWIPRELREKKHFWIAETTVVREAREEGFAFIGCAEHCWHTEDDFVLNFQRPKELENPGNDPDTFLPIPLEKRSHLFLPLAIPYRHPVIVALGQARELMIPILKNSSGEGLDIVLEEWATQKEERPPLPFGVSLPSVLTKNGDPNLTTESIDAVFFLDSYHLLFHGKTLLAKIYEKLSPTGCIYVLDRKARKPLSRREASHHGKIQPKTVKQEMDEAGFFLWFRGPPPARDRFLFVFGKIRPEKVPIEEYPFVGGPVIPETPGRWLRRNYWRLRGLKTADGRYVLFRAPGKKVYVEKVPSSSSGKEMWKIPKEKLVLYFEKKDEKYLLTDYRSLDR